jgi:hypothetical protein
MLARVKIEELALYRKIKVRIALMLFILDVLTCKSPTRVPTASVVLSESVSRPLTCLPLLLPVDICGGSMKVLLLIPLCRFHISTYSAFSYPTRPKFPHADTTQAVALPTSCFGTSLRLPMRLSCTLHVLATISSLWIVSRSSHSLRAMDPLPVPLPPCPSSGKAIRTMGGVFRSVNCIVSFPSLLSVAVTLP